MDIEIINILKKHGCLYMADDYKELLTDIQEHYKQAKALQLLQPDVSGSLPSQELIEMLKECRDLLVMCTLIDKSGHCKSLVDKVDAKMGWQ